MSELFLNLTPDWVLRAVEAGGFEPTGHIMALHCLENRVYDLKLEDESHVVAKFYRPGRWTREQIIEEHDFLFDMQEAEIPICAPLRFASGESVHEVEGMYYAVWPRTGGRSPQELSDDEVEILGRLVARIHNVGDGYDFEVRPELSAQTYGIDNLEILQSGFLPPQWSNRYADAVNRLADLYDDRIQGVPHHRIHADCHYANLLLGREGWFFLDFDDTVTGPAVQDVWLLVPGRDAEDERRRELFVEAYRTFREFEPRWLQLVEPLRALRYVRYAGWIAKRWDDPAFPRSFPHFNTEIYWQKETMDLEEQIQRCAQGATW